MKSIDTIDIKLLCELRRDARAQLTTLGKRCGIPVSTVYDRLARFKKQGIRFTPLFEWSELGCSLMVCFVAPYSESLVNHPNVNNCVRLSTNALFLECVFASLREVESFKELVPNAKVYPVIDVLKKEQFVPGL
jgi:DNA-binding Lrp family transcriptional regulator